MTRSSYSLLTRTDLDLSELDGVVEYVGDVVVVHQPKNPGYRWGNFLQLPGPPTAEELDRRIEEFERRFASDPAIEHVTLRWDGAPPAPAVARLAAERGMTRDGGLEMVAESLSPPSQSELVVRQLDMVHERPLIVALNIACDPSEQQGDSGYVEFKQRTREAWWAWHAAGAASWWGAFLQGELVGQCGFVSCSDGLGRFQSVETHPDHRRRGVCSALVSAVGSQALDAGGCRAVLLAADAEGPAVGLYERLGFRRGESQHCFLLGGDSTEVRLEAAGDRAEVRSILHAAFGEPGEASAVEALRGEPEVLSLAAERGGTLLGHALFSPVSGLDEDGTPRRGMALGPVGVRPSQQGQGVGSALIREGLERCRQAGWEAAFVLGDPAYYQRFGWRPAAEWGLRCQWDVPAGAFQALELVPGGLAGWAGLVSYHPAFDELG